MEALIALDLASAEFLRQVAALQPEHWSKPTPCDGWCVQDLVSHVLSGCVSTAALLNGASRAEVETIVRPEIDGDIVEMLRSAMDAHSAAFAIPGVLDLMLDHPSQAMKGRHLLGYRTVDMAAHAWDIARACGFDEQLDPRAVEYCWKFLQPLSPVIAHIDIFGAGPSGTVPESAPLQQRMLDFSGRRP